MAQKSHRKQWQVLQHKNKETLTERFFENVTCFRFVVLRRTAEKKNKHGSKLKGARWVCKASACPLKGRPFLTICSTTRALVMITNMVLPYQMIGLQQMRKQGVFTAFSSSRCRFLAVSSYIYHENDLITYLQR